MKNYQRRFEHIGIGASVFGIVAIMFLVVALWQNWINIRGVSHDTDESTERGLAITVDTKEVSEDIQAAQKTIEAVSELTTVKGTVAKTDVQTRMLVLDRDGEELALYVEDSTEFFDPEDEPIEFSKLEKGQDVTAVYKDDGQNMNVAQKVTMLEQD